MRPATREKWRALLVTSTAPAAMATVLGLEAIQQLPTRHGRNAQVLRRDRRHVSVEGWRLAANEITHRVGVEHVQRHHRFSKNPRGFSGSFSGRSFMKSAGTSAWSRSAKKKRQALLVRLADRITSPVTASRRM